MACKLKMGDIVRLNDNGLEIIFGRKLGLSHMKTLEMRVVGVADESITFPEETYPIAVDHNELNAYMIDDTHFDLVRRPK
jgi:hypothetical protein